jgi:hypothetical protein
LPNRPEDKLGTLEEALEFDRKRNYQYTANKLKQLKEVHAVQGQPGTWDYDPYMQGMYNGLELALAIMEDREPQYRDLPVVPINNVVQDCIEAIQMTMSRGIRDDYYRGQYDAITSIKKRFNIE